MKRKVSVSWSGGKDSAFALFKILRDPLIEVVELHTVFHRKTGRVGMHGTSRAVIEKQVKATGFPLKEIWIEDPSNESYERSIRDYYKSLSDVGVTHVVFGDIFLEDLKIFRDRMLSSENLTGLYPLWKQDPKSLLAEFFDSGFKTIICAANARYFSKVQVGQPLTFDLIKSVDAAVDPCGENGEFHTFVVEGPIFSHPIAIELGDVVEQHNKFSTQNADGSLSENTSTFFFREIS